ncbi:MAG: hypothetical protein R2712_31360 [Vicinamibacterales bacterium]
MNMTMMRSVAVLVPVLMAAPALAQEQVTVVKRDGEKISGRFEDWNRQTDTVYVRVSQDDQRKFPMRDVRVIDIGGSAESLPASETEAASGNDYVLVTRGGETLRGRLVNIEGGEGSAEEGEPRSVTFDAGGERRFKFSEIARIYTGQYPQQTSSSSSSTADVPAGAIRVAADQQWTQTNIVVREGDRVQFTTTGEVQLSTDGADKASSAGSLKGRHAEGSPAPQFLAGALIGRIDNGQPFAIGNQTTALPMPAAGRLWLGVNDDQVGDNSGAFVVNANVIRK